MRAYREGDEKGILELWQAVYPGEEYERERWIRWWHWMYKDNPAGAGMIWLAEHNGKIVGQSAIIPVAMKVGTETATGFQSINTMTHPNYRRQGMYESLARKAYAEAAREGICIGYRFPNKVSHLIAIKRLNWFDVDTMQVLYKPLDWMKTSKTMTGNKFLAGFLAMSGNITARMFYRAERVSIIEGLTITQVPFFDERINQFWDRACGQYQIMVMRNKDYLNWRYVAVPDVDYSIYIAEKSRKICGYLVLRCVQREQMKAGIIFDILAESGEIAGCLISQAIEHCKQKKVDYVYYGMIANKQQLRAVRRNGFMSVPFARGIRFCAYSSSSHISKEFLKDSRNWFVQIGDSDVI